MGLGCGYAIAAALIEQKKPDRERAPVVAVQGDSAFGFSGMEVETASRHVYTVEPPNKGHFGANSFVPCREVVPISEVK